MRSAIGRRRLAAERGRAEPKITILYATRDRRRAHPRAGGSGEQFAALGGMYGELLDDRIGEQFRRKLGDPLLGGRLAELDLEPLALANRCDLAEAEAAARAGNGLALGV